jgi:hypothetical protein
MDKTAKLAQNFLLIAKKDLKASQVLYEARLYAQSYFFFQQATEKAVKSLYAFIGTANSKEIFDVRHNVFKLQHKEIEQTKKRNEAVKAIVEIMPFFEKLDYITQKQTEQKNKDLDDTMLLISELKQYDLINIPSRDLTKYLKHIESIKLRKLKTPNEAAELFKKEIDNFILNIENEGSPKAVWFAKLIKNEWEYLSLDSRFILDIVESILESLNIAKVHIVFHYCSLLTIQHSSITRYFDNRNPGPLPSEIYTKKLPVVRLQPKFMKHLNEAMNGFQEFITQYS